MLIFQGVAKKCLFGTAEPELRTSLGLLEEKPKPNLNQIRESVVGRHFLFRQCTYINISI